jgi:DNA uptake protein ComE-like DNA-binding protein
VSRELDEWRRRTAAAGLDVAKVENAARRQRGLPPLPAAVAAPASSGGGSQPRARRGDPAVRPDRATREGVAQSGSALWDRLRSIAESDLGDDEKRDLYESVGVNEDRVRQVLAQIEVGEAAESEPVEFDGIADRLERQFGPPKNDAQRAYIEQFRAQDDAQRAALTERRDAELAARLDSQRAELEREEPWWMTTLKVIDKPRAVIVAGFSQLGAALDGDDETVASWDRFSEQVGDNVTVSSLLPEDMPGWARFMVGFGVDVALDPLTYLTGGSAAVAKVAGKGGLKAANILVRASDDAAEAAIKATQAGDAATAAVKLAEADEFLKLSGRVGEVGGFGGLSQPERLVLERAAKATGTIGEGASLRGGVYFRLPGTEGVRLPGLSEALTPVSRYTARGTVGLRGTKLWERVSHPFETPRRAFLQQFSRSSLRQQKEALSAYRGVTLGTMRKAKFVEQMQAIRSGLLVQTKRLGVDGGDMLRYLDAPDAVGADGLLNPVARLIAGEADPDGAVTNLAAGWREFFETARKNANDLAGEEWLRSVGDNYSFHVLDLLDDGEDALEAASRLSGGAGGRQPIGPEMRRSIQPGRNYRGVEIMEADDPRNIARFGGALSPEDQALEILRRTGAVDEADRLFSKDLAGVSELYVNSVGSRLQNRVVARSLRDDGVGMAADRFARMQYGASVVEQNMFVRKERFGAQVAAWREADGDGISVTADIGAASDALARALTGAGNVDELDAALKMVSDRLGFMSPRAGALADEMDGAMRRLATEAERAFRDGDAAEVFDLASVGIGNRSAQHIEAIEAVQDELAQMAAGLDTLGLARIDAALTVTEKRVLEQRAVLFQDFAEQAVGRNLESEVADRAAVAAQRVFYDELLDRVQVLRSGLTQAGELARRVDQTVAGAISDLGRFERALLPGSDGVARLSNGAVARFTRTGGGVRRSDVGDRVGVRFPLADDVDAADARFLGDTAGTRAEQGAVQVPRVVVPDMPEFHGVTSQVNGFGNPDWRRMQEAASQFSNSPIRGTPIAWNDPRIPDTLYHVSPYGGSIDADGVLRARGVGGLGGDARDRIVSLTASREVAEQLASDMTLMARVAQTDDAETIFNLLVADMRQYGKTLTPGDLRQLRRQLAASDKPTTMDVYFYTRDFAGGPRNPLFFGQDPDLSMWRNLPIADIRIATVPKANLNTGALVTDFDLGRGFLDEIRVYGDVPVSSVAPRPNRPRPVFDFTSSVGRPLTYSGPTATAQMNADILLTGTRNRQLPLQKTALSTDNVFADSLLWNQFVELTERAARTNTPPSVFVDTLNGLVRRYAALDADSFAARVAAISDNPAETLLDGVLNRNALNVVERSDMGVWDEFMEGVTVNPDKLAKAYRSDLSKRGWDGVLLDDGATRELVSFGPQQMRGENEASRLLLRIEAEQAKMGSRLNDLRVKFQSTADRMAVKPELLDGNARSAAAARRASQKRVASLGQKRARQGLSAAEDAELVMRGGANDAFKLANEAEREADQLVAAAKQARRAEVRQAQAAGLEVGPPPPRNPRVDELRNEAKTLRLLAQSDVAEADLLAAGVARDFDFVFTGKLAETPGLAERMTEMLTQNMKALNDFTLAPEQIVDVLTATARLQNPAEVKKLLRAWDYITGVFKSYAVMTTGFISRNAVGAAMNNWLGLVNVKSYPEFFKADKLFIEAFRKGDFQAGLAAVEKQFGARGRQAYEAWTEMAAGSAGGLAAQWAGDVGVAAADAIERTGILAAARGAGGQGLRDNSVTRAFFYANTRMEYRIRGVMAWDEVYRKGGDMQSAIDRVYQFHFDYSPSGLSRFESGTLRRIIPFYVWTANNLPLQLKGLVTRPKVAASYFKFKQNMEELSEDQGIVPDYFGRLGAIRMPWTNSDGNNVYFMPDLPFRDLGMFGSIKPTVNPIDFISNLVNMDEVKGMLNPIIRVPAETLIADEKFFSGAPFREGFVSMGALGRIPGLGPALGAMGQARRDKDGNWLVNEKNLYAVESFMPLISRATRLFPTDDKGREKVWTAWLSTFVGLGFRTNTWTEQSNQLFRLQDRLNTAMRSQETLGTEFPTKTEIQRRNTEDAQVASLQGFGRETDFLLGIINSGDVAALAELDGFGDDSAAKVAASVANSGAFTDVRDLVTARDVNVSGVEKAVQSLRERSEYTLDVGTAGPDELEAMPNIGPKTVEKIMRLRDGGGLVSLGSLRQVGLSARQIEEIRAWIDEQREFQARLVGVL